MAIAKNFIKHAEALLYQMELELSPVGMVVQNLSAAARRIYARCLAAGTLDKSKWLPAKAKKKPAKWRALNVPGTWWWAQGTLA